MVIAVTSFPPEEMGEKQKVWFISNASSWCRLSVLDVSTCFLLCTLSLSSFLRCFPWLWGFFFSLCFVRCAEGWSPSSSVSCLTHVCLVLWLIHWAVNVFSCPQRSGFQNGSHRLTKRGNVWQAAVTDAFVASALIYSDFCLTGYRWCLYSCQQRERDGIQAFRYGDSLYL